MAIAVYFASNVPSSKGNVSHLIWRLSQTIGISIGIYVIAIKCIGKTNIITKYSDVVFYIGTLAAIFSYENPITYEKCCSKLDYNPGYALWWISFETQFVCFVLSFLFKRWFSRSLFFLTLIIYFSILKVDVNSDLICVGKAYGFSFIYVMLMYNIEKANRESFYDLYKLMNNEKVWKKIIDTMHQSIIILNQDKELLYYNQGMIDSMCDYYTNPNAAYSPEEIIAFLKNFKDIQLRKSFKSLQIQYQNSFSIFTDENTQNKHLRNEKSFIDDNDNLNELKQEFQNAKLFDEVISLYANYLKKNPQLNNNFIIFDCVLQNKKIEIQIQKVFFEEKLCILAILTDHTQRDLISKLERNDKYKNIILSTVSHELRAPINSTKIMLQAAIDDPEIPKEPKAALLEPSLRSLGILANFINDILDYSQIQANKLKLVFQSVDIRQIIRDVCVLIEMQCNRKGLRLLIDIAKKVPTFFTTDPNRLTQIMLNLLSNAVKFTVHGQIVLSVSYYSVQNKILKISVEDTGIGIKPEDIPKLFKEFGQLDLGDDAKLNPNGCGLGLSIANKLAKNLGPLDSLGIQIKSEYGKGSIFSFKIQDKEMITKQDSSNNGIITNLDFNQLEEDFDSNAFNEFRKSETSLSKFTPYTQKDCINSPRFTDFITNLKSKFYMFDQNEYKNSSEDFKETARQAGKILIVDDDMFSLYSIEIILKSLQIPFETADSGIKAIEILSNNKPTKASFKLMLIDFNMPQLNGIETTTILRQMMNKNTVDRIPIIGCTAFNDEIMREQGLKAGMDDIISKPLSKNKILKLFNG